MSGRSETPLSGPGVAQARRLGLRLAATPLAAVHSSPRRRAQETAAAVAKHAEVAVETIAALDEIDFAGWSERSFAALEAEPGWRAWNTVRGKTRVPGGESQAEATARAVAHIEAAAGAHAGETIACVTHCDIIRGVVCHYLGLPFDNLLRFDIDAASVSTLLVGQDAGYGGARVTGVNDDGRLSGEG